MVETVDLACDAPTYWDAAAGMWRGGAYCPYAPTMFGHEGDDDNCKYHVRWSSTALCEEPGAVTFTVVATRKTDGSPLTGAAPIVEVLVTTLGDQDAADYCDDMSPWGGPNDGVQLTEGPPGTYVGPIYFNRPGEWTLRFHFFPTCNDAPDSPHGHAAFHVTIP